MNQRGTLIELPAVIAVILICGILAAQALLQHRWLKGGVELLPAVILLGLLGRAWWEGRDR